MVQRIWRRRRRAVKRGAIPLPHDPLWQGVHFKVLQVVRTMGGVSSDGERRVSDCDVCRLTSGHIGRVTEHLEMTLDVKPGTQAVGFRDEAEALQRAQLVND